MKIEGYLSDIEFYSNVHDPLTRYAEFEVPSLGDGGIAHKMFVDMEDEKLLSYIRVFILPEVGGKASASVLLQEVKDLINLYGNPDTVAPRVRTAGKLCEGLIEYDLNTPSHEYVRVTSEGWRVVKKAKHKFLKRNTLGAQVLPVRTDKNLLSLLAPFVNTDKEGLMIFTTWLVQAFCMGNHSALLAVAEAGAGKSTATKFARHILDPSNLQATVMPVKKDDLFSILSNAYFVAFDNTSEEFFTKEISDILCSAITGSTMAKRKLYTTNELGVYELHSALIINGIDIIPTQSDLASRCLLLKLKPIDESHRKTDEELTRAFKRSLPEILGAIFDALSKAMTIIKTLKPAKLPRMASSYIEMLAVAIALGISESDFESIYFANLALMDKARANIAVVEAVREYMNSEFVTGRSIEGKVGDIYSKISANYSGSNRDFPKSPSQFSRKLRQELKTFHAIKLNVILDDTFADGTHLKIVKEK